MGNKTAGILFLRPSPLLSCCHPLPSPHHTSKHSPHLSIAKYVMKPYQEAHIRAGQCTCIKLGSHRHFPAVESQALRAFVCSKQGTNIRQTHTSLPRDTECLGATSYTTQSLQELRAAQHFQKAECLYLDSQMNLAT